MNWQEKITQIAVRQREPGLLDTEQYDGQVDMPRFKYKHIEDHLYIVSLEVLRETSDAELQAIGSSALVTYAQAPFTQNGITYIELGQNVIRIIGVSVDGKPAVKADMGNFIQRLNGGSRTSNCYTFYSGRIGFNGASISALAVFEPEIDSFRFDLPILPQGRDMEIIDRAHKRMMIDNFEHSSRP